MVKWEYKVTLIPTKDRSLDTVEKKLNELGALGWELIHVEKGHTFDTATFKRPKQ